jgi:uncharacterized protein YbaR (Trm112 family)
MVCVQGRMLPASLASRNKKINCQGEHIANPHHLPITIYSMASPISTELLEILRCPYCVSTATRQPGDDPGKLTLYKDCWLIEPVYGRKYPIVDGIPIMLVETGEKWMNTKPEDLPVPPPAE